MNNEIIVKVGTAELGEFKGLTSIAGRTYVKYMSGWGTIMTAPIEVTTLA